MTRLKKGFTIVELLVVVSIISLLIAILLPAIGKARDAALITQSLGNLRNMSAACNAYGADYNDRQFTACPDDLGQYGANPAAACTAMSASQCIPQLILGWDSGGGLWGYWTGGELQRCSNWPGTCGGFIYYVPCWYWSPNAIGKPGSWRIPNVKAFNQYVSGRFYDKVFWAPKDRLTYEGVDEYFRNPVEFDFDGIRFAEPTYCWSPAAMWSPAVMSWKRATAAGGSTDPCQVKLGAAPANLPGAYKSPVASMCQYPSLKWRMWEHQWLQNTEGGDVNPCFNVPTPWFYNLGYNSAPCVMYFDGHTQMVSLAGTMQDNDLAASQMSGGIGSPLYFHSINEANDGYYAQCAYDMMTNNQPCRPPTPGFATVDGILGRDQIRLGD
jgi:prepilin-type N-terminal cleavage/methylation domain-containing protein